MPGREGGVNKGLLLSGYRVSVLQDDKTSGDLWPNNVNMPTTTTCTLSNGRDGGFYVVVVQSLSVSDSLRHRGLQHTRLPFPSPTPGVC